MNNNHKICIFLVKEPVINCMVLLLLLLVWTSCEQKKQLPDLTANSATSISKLIDGNHRFANLLSTHPDVDLQHLQAAAKGQNPFAVIVCCSDSRVSPELVFDQGIGDLFVIRTAGNIIGGVEIGSIEYAVEHLNVKTIVVMGHENCGAIKAYIEGGDAPGHIKDIIDSLTQEIEIKAIPIADVNRIDDCVTANVRHGLKQLQTQSSLISEKLQSKKLELIGARYDLDDFKISLIK